MTEALTVDGEIIETQAPITLFGTDDPTAIVERASAIATSLADVLKRKKLVAKIGNREHVLVEGWTLLGSMLGVFAEVEWTRAIEGGWEARAVARTLRGNTVGAAEAMCTRSESTWRTRDDYALRSMAQTRAVSKALRMPLGFIVELAGYSATPAEELNEAPGQGVGPSRTAAATTVDPVPVPATPQVMAAKRVAWAAGFGWSGPALEQASIDATNVPLGELDHDGWRIFAHAVVKAGPGLPIEKQATTDQGADEGEAESPPAVGASSAPAEPPPPKPGSPEYDGLSSDRKRAQATRYWMDQEVKP